MKTKHHLLIISLIGILLSCGSTKRISLPEPCPDDLACTEEYKAIVVQVRDQKGTPITLDKLTILNQTDGTSILIDQSQWQSGMEQDLGRYVILTDYYRKELQNRKVTVLLTAQKNNTQIVNRSFLLGADCCHVQHYEGELVITVE